MSTPAALRSWRGLFLPLAVGAAGVAATAYLAAVDPNQPGHYPTCPFLAVTGWYCPGCGSLRALHDLAHLDLAGALARNPFAVLVVPYLLMSWVLWVERTVTGRVPRLVAPGWSIWVLLAGIVAFWVLRNVPGWTALSPA
ncbi:MAG: DUF2752 domain-containing protein [Oryzihumus sp.]